MMMFPALMKASRLTRRGRPVSAMLALRKAMLAPPAPAPRAPRKAPAARAAAAPPSARASRPAAGGVTQAVFTGPQGTLAYRLYVPSGTPRRRLPLVVMLHGCRQDAGEFAAATAMNDVADEQGFLVLYPEQSRSASPMGCWNWHRPGDQARGSGEPALIAALVRSVADACRADPAQIYIAGLSAGGAAAAVVGAAYPDLFAAIGVHSGLAPGTASTLGEALDAMRHGSGESTAPIGRAAARALPLIVFHGDGDTVVHPNNAARFLSDLRRASPVALGERTDTGRSPGGRDYVRTIYRDGSGDVVLEGWIVLGSGHGWSGGRAGAAFTDPAGPDASREMARFFLGHSKADTATALAGR